MDRSRYLTLSPRLSVRLRVILFIMPRPYRAEALSDDARLTVNVCLSVAYIESKSRTERPRKTKIGTEVTHDSDTTFKVKRSKKVNLQEAGGYCGDL